MTIDPMRAPCGIDCGQCSIYLAAQDPGAAERLAEAWRAGGNARASADWFRCQGCRGDRAECWSEDCAIAACCGEERGLTLCSECGDFPCERLVKWGEEYPHHRQAMEWLAEERAAR